MWASKTGYWAAAGRGPPTRSSAAANATSEPRAVIVGILAETAGATSQARPKGATAPSEASPEESVRRQSRRSNPGRQPFLRHAPSTRPITASRRSRDAGRPAHAAGAVADAPRVAERGENDAIPPGDTPPQPAAASADDPARPPADNGTRHPPQP